MPEVRIDRTDYAGDFVGIRAVDHREPNGFLCVCEEFSRPASCGSRTDVHLTVLSYPAAEPMIQLTIGNFT